MPGQRIRVLYSLFAYNKATRVLLLPQLEASTQSKRSFPREQGRFSNLRIGILGCHRESVSVLLTDRIANQETALAIFFQEDRLSPLTCDVLVVPTSC